MIKNIHSLLKKYITLGIAENTPKNNLKKIQLLHIFCNTWHLFTLFSFIEDYFKSQLIIASYPIMFLLVLTTQYLLYSKNFKLASYTFIFSLITVVFFYSNFWYTAELLEYYAILPFAIALIYLDNKITIISILIICLLSLYVPNFYFKHYPIAVFNNLNAPFLFFSLYVIINYFKNLNIRNEKRLEDKTRELEDLDKFKSQFFTNISHEIRTPLALVNGYISELNTKELDQKEIQENVKKQVHKITYIVDSVLDLAKMQSLNFKLKTKSINVSEVLQRIQMNFEPLFNQKNIQFSLNTNDTAYFSIIDTVFFEKAINNLIINALKYTDNGKVTIKTYTQENRLIITVSDTGIGISERDQKNIFKRFHQVKNNINTTGGSGIGLAFSKEIIELHKGTISIKSDVYKGSEFIINIPLDRIENINPIAKNKTNTVIAKDILPTPIYRANTFLIVDDNFEMRKYIVSILKGNICFEAANGLEALQILEEEPIDLVITDYMMPKLNGYDLVTKMNRETPVIMLTAKTDDNFRLQALQLGIDDYITKPFEKEELLTRMNNCLKNNLTRKTYNEAHYIDQKLEKQDPFIKALQHYIFENSSKTNLNQETIAYEFNVSKSSFYRKVKSKTGLSPNNFIKELRLQKARSISQEKPTISLKELASKVGFSHTSYFSKIYAERFGIKPKQNSDYKTLNM